MVGFNAPKTHTHPHSRGVAVRVESGLVRRLCEGRWFYLPGCLQSCLTWQDFGFCKPPPRGRGAVVGVEAGAFANFADGPVFTAADLAEYRVGT